MNISKPFIERPVATTLLTAALVISGAIGFRLLPVAALPQVDFPTIQVSAALPGASEGKPRDAGADPRPSPHAQVATIRTRLLKLGGSCG